MSLAFHFRIRKNMKTNKKSVQTFLEKFSSPPPLPLHNLRHAQSKDFVLKRSVFKNDSPKTVDVGAPAHGLILRQNSGIFRA
jgi:hypothetical protein